MGWRDCCFYLCWLAGATLFASKDVADFFRLSTAGVLFVGFLLVMLGFWIVNVDFKSALRAMYRPWGAIKEVFGRRDDDSSS